MGERTSEAPSTLADLLASGADETVALATPGAPPPLPYSALRSLVAQSRSRLNDAGIGRGDRVAIVLPNGPQMACAFLAVASGATAARLNPAYRAEEFEFYMSDLKAKALIVEAGAESPAIPVAEKLGVTILRLQPKPEAGAGAFAVEGESGAGTRAGGPAEADDVALILHTSGTTSRPKIVPLSQTNICASARHIATTLELGPRDCGLHVMPLFHIHGLMAGLLAPLLAGGRVFSTPGFNALKFFAWLEESEATWYTAVPTMHQAILARSGHHRDTIERRPLRFIRSSSSSMPPQVIAELEKTFAASVIEAYGMTEASHQMASNPLRGLRKPGSVGIPAGPEIAIMGPEGKLLARNSIGEVVIRGANVTSGYENNPQANADAFVDGWFRTGDQGLLDDDGHLTLTGRIKEIIIRGGEKISPREVDEVLMDHPAVRQVVVFAVKHDMLGEDVAAAVVLREGSSASEQQLRAFASARLAPFKVPRKVIFLDQIPLGATGKLQRIGLARKLGLE